jgi:hypothetical protein
MRWVGHVTCEGDKRYRFLWGGLKERVHSEDLGVDRWILLNWTFKRLDVEAWIGLIWLKTATDVGLFPMLYKT